MSELMPVWKHIKWHDLWLHSAASDAVRRIESAYPGILIEVDEDDLWVSSDYSGTHKGAPFQTYSFLVTTSKYLGYWDLERTRFRKEFLPDSRRISYKKLRDRMRWRALKPFLDIADDLYGNLITFVVDSRLGSLFADGRDALAEEFPTIFPSDTPNSVVEETLRIGSFMALLLAGLKSEGQRGYWVSDQDITLDSTERGRRMGKLAGAMSCAMADWKEPARVEMFTTKHDDDSRALEDLAAIPDLAAGALAKFTTLVVTPPDDGSWRGSSIPNEYVEDERALEIVRWLGAIGRNLRRLVLRIALDERGEIRVRAEQIFAG